MVPFCSALVLLVLLGQVERLPKILRLRGPYSAAALQHRLQGSSIIRNDQRIADSDWGWCGGTDRPIRPVEFVVLLQTV